MADISNIMTASVSLTAILIAVFGILTANRITLRNSGADSKSIKRYQSMIWVIIGFIGSTTITTIISGLYEIGFITDARAILIMFILNISFIAIAMFVVAIVTRYKGA